jgi:hypothetical protein
VRGLRSANYSADRWRDLHAYEPGWLMYYHRKLAGSPRQFASVVTAVAVGGLLGGGVATLVLAWFWRRLSRGAAARQGHRTS